VSAWGGAGDGGRGGGRVERGEGLGAGVGRPRVGAADAVRERLPERGAQVRVRLGEAPRIEAAGHRRRQVRQRRPPDTRSAEVRAGPLGEERLPGVEGPVEGCVRAGAGRVGGALAELAEELAAPGIRELAQAPQVALGGVVEEALEAVGPRHDVAAPRRRLDVAAHDVVGGRLEEHARGHLVGARPQGHVPQVEVDAGADALVQPRAVPGVGAVGLRGHLGPRGAVGLGGGGDRGEERVAGPGAVGAHGVAHGLERPVVHRPGQGQGAREPRRRGVGGDRDALAPPGGGIGTGAAAGEEPPHVRRLSRWR
jgi:hypothetical protein